MKSFVSLILIVFPLSAFAQYFVGDSKEDVLKVLRKKNVKFEESQVTDSTSRISVLEENNYQMIWVLDSNDKVLRQTLIPYRENGVNEFVKIFNRDYVVVSDTEWKSYSSGKIFLIKLEFIYREPLFSITLFKELDDNQPSTIFEIDILSNELFGLRKEEIRIVEGGI